MVKNLPANAGHEVVKNLPANSGHGFKPWVGKIPWRRAWKSTPVFLPAESHGQRSLVSYSPWDHKESAVTEQWTLCLYANIGISQTEYKKFRTPND